ncbi:active spliceosome conformation promoter CWC2 [Kluyveromyces lactis]|uniref:Pre-mRNA-splicing factor CWC2 n=1 Tax=Kluyveromyces lactis (strain ATCC 8585 / CBS 2359 / DSM 70799 / NBRC 1267 / NRRL Y-1140 / WM37) TaxID=284590 RepID=CWC2_KLULA|nr:uncharacterized protein KLLA0_C15411g [Kluyveromyces lactis]Q6CT50.1 RecName: Full=Pre-mRNA-splicing factor CWC2 [Kluyveromyces lactis NRRL Y-1140]CAH01740.1 KLLA0C15411p [Kluyveromyces lactis]|eukprot:XP_452889.1 uncharacterized protein KLLA0_C15411g [Kluyveromyces lactis]
MTGDWKNRPARVQLQESDLPSSVPPQTGLAFNVWYNKWSQGQSGSTRFVTPYSLDPENDSGITKGDKEGRIHFCLYFAKGMCCLGKNCRYLHHIPEPDDFARLALHSSALDCFGREKFADYRDDMGGVGSFKKPNRVLYVGGITGALNNKTLKPHQIENRVKYKFGKLGELDSVRYVESKNCAFVKFKLQCNSEFTKEAMGNQTLLIPTDKEWDLRKEGTGLLVKWANEDPNPAVRKRELEEQTQETLKAIKQLVASTEGTVNQKRKVEEINEVRDSQANSRERFSIRENAIIDKTILDKLKQRKVTITNTNVAANITVSKPSSVLPLVTQYSSDED